MRIISFNLNFAKNHDQLKELILKYVTKDTIICFQEVSGGMYLFFEQYLRRELPPNTKIFATPLKTKVKGFLQYQSMIIPPSFEIQSVESIPLKGIVQDPNKFIQKIRFAYKGIDFTILNVHEFVSSWMNPLGSLKLVFDEIDKKRTNFIVGDFNLNVSKYRKILRDLGIIELTHAIRESFTVYFKNVLGAILRRAYNITPDALKLRRYKTDAIMIYSKKKFKYETRNIKNHFSDHDIIILDIDFKVFDKLGT